MTPAPLATPDSTAHERDRAVARAPVLTGFAAADVILERYAGALGGDRDAYAGHVARVLAFYAGLAPGHEAPDAVQVAGAFHDLGIWTARSWDYLAPSVRLARDHLAAVGREDLADEVARIILEHHKLLPYRGVFQETVETFRRADLVDLSLGAIRFSLPREAVRSIRATHPNAGFHRRLTEIGGRWAQ
jgi:predicted metal-dependent HD superfamily phosphohydrolase